MGAGWSTVSRRVPSPPTIVACSTATACSRPWPPATVGYARSSCTWPDSQRDARGSESRCPTPRCSRSECQQVLEDLGTGVVKLVVTRGTGPRGYRPPREPTVTRVVMASALRATSAPGEGIVVRVCETRLARNARLAGIKHLNRLEQVLACAEWDDAEIAEGLMLATDDRLIGATAANIFLVRHGRLHTPEIRDCGVAGVMRHQVLRPGEDAGPRRGGRRLRPARASCGGRDLSHQCADGHPAGNRGTGRGVVAAWRSDAEAADTSRRPGRAGMKRLLVVAVVLALLAGAVAAVRVSSLARDSRLRSAMHRSRSRSRAASRWA